jgi:hypothetical protein
MKILEVVTVCLAVLSAMFNFGAATACVFAHLKNEKAESAYLIVPVANSRFFS